MPSYLKYRGAFDNFCPSDVWKFTPQFCCHFPCFLDQMNRSFICTYELVDHIMFAAKESPIVIQSTELSFCSVLRWIAYYRIKYIFEKLYNLHKPIYSLYKPVVFYRILSRWTCHWKSLQAFLELLCNAPEIGRSQLLQSITLSDN